MLFSPYAKPKNTPTMSHPRLLLTPSDMPRIRGNMERSENKIAVDVFESLLDTPITATGATQDYGNYDMKEVLAVEAFAFRALLSGSKADAEKAISAVVYLLERFDPKGYMSARWGGHLIFAAAEVYDWCYAYIPDETKLRIIDMCEDTARCYFEMKYPPCEQGAISGHGAEAQLLRDLMAFSIAVYDERPDIYDYCAGRIYDEYVPAYRLYFEGGAHNQGPTYGAYRFTSAAICELMMRVITGKPFFENLVNVPDYLALMLRPDGECMRLGDDFNEKKTGCNHDYPFTVPFFYSYAITGRREFERLFREGLSTEYLLPVHHGIDYYKKEGSWGEGLLSPVMMLIFDRFTEAKDAPIPKAKYFGSPVGMTVFKKDDTAVLMKLGEYWGANHDHLDTGCFQIFRGAPLISESGLYGDYHSPHRMQYLIRTAAHNCLTVERTDRNQFGEWKDTDVYDGGTKRPNKGNEPATIDVLMSGEYHMATVLSHSESDGGCEITGDLSDAYCHSCSRVIRSMKYDHSTHTLTVHDEIDSHDAEYKKTFHIHTQVEPTVDGDTVTIVNKGYRAVCRVLSPKNAIITKVGGDGHGFEIDGCNFPPDETNCGELGWGEVRISPSENTVHTEFSVEIETFGCSPTDCIDKTVLL